MEWTRTSWVRILTPVGIFICNVNCYRNSLLKDTHKWTDLLTDTFFNSLFFTFQSNFVCTHFHKQTLSPKRALLNWKFEFFFCLFGKCSKCTVFRKLNTLLVKSNFKYRRVDINSRTYITRTFPWLMKLPADRWWPVNTGPLYTGSTEVVLFRWLQGYPSLRRKRFWNDIWQMLPCNKTLENRNEDDREKCLKWVG